MSDGFGLYFGLWFEASELLLFPPVIPQTHCLRILKVVFRKIDLPMSAVNHVSGLEWAWFGFDCIIATGGRGSMTRCGPIQRSLFDHSSEGE